MVIRRIYVQLFDFLTPHDRELQFEQYSFVAQFHWKNKRW